MTKSGRFIWALGAAATFAPSALAATATFTPVGPTQVPRGEPVSFNIVVTASGSGFNSADIIVGSTDAADLTFTYSPAWTTAFSNVTQISYDNGFFSQDVFVGGNHSVSVGQSKTLGTITIDTANMGVGAHSVFIDNALDGVSTLGLAGVPESLAGSAVFEVTPPVPAASTWGLVVLSLGIGILGTLAIRHGITPLHAY